MRIIYKVLSVFFGLGFIGQLIAGKLFIAGLILSVVFGYFGWREISKKIESKDVDSDKKTSEFPNSKINLREKERNESLERIAINMGISPNEVKEDYILELKKKGIGNTSIDEVKQHFQQLKLEESGMFNVSPENTPSAFMEEWYEEYMNNRDYQHMNTIKSDMKYFIDCDSDLHDTLINNEDIEFENFSRIYNFLNLYKVSNRSLKMNSELDTMLNYNSFKGEVVKSNYFLEKVNESILFDCDINITLNIIEFGLLLYNSELAPYYYERKAYCYNKLGKFKVALESIDKAIDLLSVINWAKDIYLFDYLILRSEIKNNLGDKKGAMKDIEMAKEHKEVIKEEETNYEEDYSNDLPF